MTPCGQGQVLISLFFVFISIANWTVDEVIQTLLSQCICLGKSQHRYFGGGLVFENILISVLRAHFGDMGRLVPLSKEDMFVCFFN